jgi:hypothetical protein
MQLVSAVRAVAAALLASAAGLLAGCSPLSVAVTAVGIATDTSVTWEVVKHVGEKLTENDPTPCIQLGGVQRALHPRCDYAPGRFTRADLSRTGLQECPLALATRDARLWRALPELLEKGARVDRCAGSPLAELAAVDACPDFAAAPPAVVKALRTLAESDPRAVRHDVFRMLGCPSARAAGLDRVLHGWLERGDLEPHQLSFSPLGAADPDLLVGALGAALEARGHKAETALDGYDGVLPTGFETALRTSHWQALDWWLTRLPRLANTAPPTRGGQLVWIPLYRVLQGGYLAHPSTQRDMVGFLLARGADPRQRLPFDSGKTVVAWARQANSPMLALLDPPAPIPEKPLRQAATKLAEPEPR